ASTACAGAPLGGASGTPPIEGWVNTGGKLAGPVAAGGGIPAPGPEGGARLTAAPGARTEAGGTGGRRALKRGARGGGGKTASKTANASTGNSRSTRRHRKMPSPPESILLLFTENAANSSLRPSGPFR